MLAELTAGFTPQEALIGLHDDISSRQFTKYHCTKQLHLFTTLESSCILYLAASGLHVLSPVDPSLFTCRSRAPMRATT